MKSPLEVLRLYPEHDYTLNGVFESRAAMGLDRPFLLHQGVLWTFRSFGDAVGRLAQLLLARGIAKGDRVAVMAGNRDSHILLLFALARIGAIMVPVNPDYGVPEARYVLDHAEVSAVAATSATLPVVRNACAEMAQKPWFVSLDQAEADAPLLTDLMKEYEDKVTLPVEVTADDTCLIIYTSGTTGFPKGVMHSQRVFVGVGEANVQRLHLQENDRLMIVLPLFHVNALFYSAAGTLASGASMAVVPKFSASSFWRDVVELGATQVNVIEAVGSILMVRPRSEFQPDHKLRIMYGVRQNAIETFRNEFGVERLVAGFGMTEIPGVLCTPYDGLYKAGSMGMIGGHPDPAKGMASCRIVDDDGKDVGVDQVGEFWVKTPNIMQGYYRDPEQTKDSFRDGWFMTGDLVRRDADGDFFYVSRKKDIIRRRGENISGAELDRVIGTHPGVFEAAAIAVPAELGEDEILVLVVTKEGQKPTAEDIAQWCRERLAPMKVPRYVLFVNELPHTPTHEVLKTVLRSDKTLKQRATDLQAKT